MSPGLPSLEDLVHAICEGTPVDWDALEQVGSDTFRSQVQALRVVARIAEMHRPQTASGGGVPGTPPATLQRWGHLDVLEHIASGAFGDVYRAWDPQLDREVALKLLRRAPDADAHADEVVDEGRLLARLRHPHIVSVYGAARIDGQVGLWMEYLRGRTLAQAVAREGALPAPRVAEIGAALCDALASVHKADLVHRDVKAQNVMLADDGRVVLTDFGASRDTRRAWLDLAGTPQYLAPEVAAGEPASPQSDLYSLGVLMRYAATGAFAPVTPASHDKALRRLLGVAATLSAPDPRHRFQSAAVCGRALRDVAGPAKTSRVFVVVGTVVAVMLGALVLSLMRAGSAQDNDDRAFEMAWRTASPRRAPISARQMQLYGFDTLSDFSLSGTLYATVPLPDRHVGLVSIAPGREDVQAWISHPTEAGHVETAIPSPDGLQMAYVWVEVACRCAGIHVVNRQGTDRTLLTRADLRGAWIGEWRGSILPALLAPEQGLHELVLIDVSSGAVRAVRQVERDPQGFSLSPDRRVLAFDAPQHRAPGAPRQIVVFEIATGREQTVSSAGRSWVMPRWSPDGERLFFLERGRENMALLAVRMEQGRAVREPVTLKDSLGSLGSFGFVGANALGYWIGDRRNFFSVEAAADGLFHASGSVRAMDTGGNMPAWSPDGRGLAWTDFGAPTGTIRFQGPQGEAKALPAVLDGAVFPTWSPDGRRLAFWTMDLLTRSVQVVDVATGRVTEHLRRGSAFYGGEFALSWTSGGTRLLISPTADQIMSLDPETGAVGTFYKPHDASIENYFYLSPDGHSLALVEERQQRRMLRVLPLDAKGRTVQQKAPDASMLIGWHPDGHSVLAIRAAVPVPDGPPEENELWLIPIDGTPERSLGLKAPGMLYAAMSPDQKRVAFESGTWSRELWLLGPP